MTGRILGHYRVLEQIGAGGMGLVYRARDTHLERDVALKVLPAGTLADQAARQRFRREALSLSRLNHPNIATIHDFDSQEGVDFLVMEYIAGAGLNERLARGALPEAEVVAFGRQLAEALVAAHRHGVVHRDLKPHNIRVTEDGRLKVLDFGLARLLAIDDPEASTRTILDTQGPVGTPPYMAPEQLRGRPADARTDIYQAGAALYEMATGQRSFGEARGPLLAEAILNRQPAPPREINKALSAGLERVILKALSKDPRNRQQSARDLLTDLERAGGPGAWAAGRRPIPQRALAATGSAALAVLLLAGGWWLLGPGRSLASLAVLPFTNDSADPDLDYLSDGITDSIIDSVSSLPRMKVISRYSAFKYKGHQIDPRRVGRELNVRAVLTGRMALRADQLQVSAELVDTRDLRRLWGESYSRGVAEIIPMQQEIAGRISEGLRLRLTGEERARLARRDTEDTEAYQLYLRGRHLLLNEYEYEGVRKAIALFEQAIGVDPRYARAYAGLAEAYYGLSNIYISPTEAMPRVKAAALEALRLDPDLGEAHAALGTVKASYELDLAGGESEFRRAIDLNPNSASTRVYFALALCSYRRFQESIEQVTRARELDPLSPFVRTYGVFTVYLAGHYEQAQRELLQQIELDPDYYLTHAFLGLVYEQTGRYAEAVEELRTASRLDVKNQEALAQLGHALAIAGEAGEAREILERLERLGASQYVSPYNVALIYAGLGNSDKLFEWLEKAYKERSEWMYHLRVDPRLRPYQADPRFNAILRRMGFPPA